MRGIGVKQFAGRRLNNSFLGRPQPPEFLSRQTAVTRNGSRKTEGFFPVYGVGRGGFPYGGGRGHCYGGAGRKRVNHWK